ncbi:hypothetical protein [uncultured Amnibacterium sp.]|uniref:hypothetical protein n=1 Tax=uncultured Amnibacterium sp. TaxID=1631851 RepID=UPI0035C9DBC4
MTDLLHAAGTTVIGAVLTSAVVAAIIGVLQNRWQERARTRAAERARLQVAFAEAFDVYTQYKEFPYAIRRRRADEPAPERIRLSEELRHIQSRLSYYRALVLSEDVAAGLSYKTLLDQVRTVAGEAMKAAWQDAAASEDRDMVIPRSLINLGALTDHEDQYLKDVTARLDQLKPKFLDRRHARSQSNGTSQC